MKYTRVYADENGESHFEDVEVEFSSVDFAPPAPPLDLSAFTPATQYGFLRAPVVGLATGIQLHDDRSSSTWPVKSRRR